MRNSDGFHSAFLKRDILKTQITKSSFIEQKLRYDEDKNKTCDFTQYRNTRDHFEIVGMYFYVVFCHYFMHSSLERPGWAGHPSEECSLRRLFRSPTEISLNGRFVCTVMIVCAADTSLILSGMCVDVCVWCSDCEQILNSNTETVSPVLEPEHPSQQILITTFPTLFCCWICLILFKEISDAWDSSITQSSSQTQNQLHCLTESVWMH